MRRPFPTYPGCPVCGDRAINPASLEMRWWWDDERSCVVGCFAPDGRQIGYAGKLHGGVLSALMDECLAWACAQARGSFCVTGELIMRFKTPAPLGEPLEIEGRVVEARGPYVRAEGSVTLGSGVVVATTVGTFSALPRAESEELGQALRLSPGDIDILAPGRGPESSAAPPPSRERARQ